MTPIGREAGSMLGRQPDGSLADHTAGGECATDAPSSHDPLCPAPACAMTGRFRLLCDNCDLAHEDCRCVCGLLARARAEERNRTLDAARAALAAVYDEHERTCEQQGCEGPDREYALAAIDVLRGES